MKHTKQSIISKDGVSYLIPFILITSRCAQRGRRVCDRMIPFLFFVFRLANIVLFLGFAK